MRSSAYEHIIPERLFSTEDNPAEGVSTAKALSLAMAQGQKIYTLTAENKSQLANITIDDNARSEISQALSLGLEVTVHERPITLNGWEGSGYSIIDTDYGVGAYKISGGANGGQVNSGEVDVVGFISMFLTALSEITKKTAFAIADFFLNYFNTAVKCAIASEKLAENGYYVFAIALMAFFFIFVLLLAMNLILLAIIAAQVAIQAVRLAATIWGILLAYYSWGGANYICDGIDLSDEK